MQTESIMSFLTYIPHMTSFNMSTHTFREQTPHRESHPVCDIDMACLSIKVITGLQKHHELCIMYKLYNCVNDIFINTSHTLCFAPLPFLMDIFSGICITDIIRVYRPVVNHTSEIVKYISQQICCKFPHLIQI